MLNLILTFPTFLELFLSGHVNIKIRFDTSLLLTNFLTNGFSHHYNLGESSFILRDIRGESCTILPVSQVCVIEIRLNVTGT